MGLKFDWFIMENVVNMFEKFGVVYEIKVVLVYCIFDLFFDYVKIVVECGFKVIIVGVGGVVYLFGMVVF